MKHAQSKVIGIFGYPVQHSKSPIMHNYVFDKLEMNYHYIPFHATPDKLQASIEGFKALGFHGANVTLPYKSKVMPFLDEVSELASLTESVNTLYWKDGKLRGTTTDGYGALRNLKAHDVDIDGKHVAILGNGGSARALAFQLAKDGKDVKITIVSRKRGRGMMLSDQINNYKANISTSTIFEEFSKIKEDIDLIINTTPIGLFPEVDAMPVEADDLLEKHIVYDIVYNPLQTKLLQTAASKGCKTVTGIGMLIYQGMKSFEYWTDQEAPEDLYFEGMKDLTE